MHKFAVAGAVIAGALPPGADIPALMAEEVTMVIKMGREFGVELDKSTAAGVLTACGCTVVGYALFETLNFAYPATIPVKVTIATGVIEAAGNLVYDYFESKYT